MKYLDQSIQCTFQLGQFWEYRPAHLKKEKNVLSLLLNYYTPICLTKLNKPRHPVEAEEAPEEAEVVATEEEEDLLQEAVIEEEEVSLVAEVIEEVFLLVAEAIEEEEAALVVEIEEEVEVEVVIEEEEVDFPVEEVPNVKNK